jgi:hypothetical protein
MGSSFNDFISIIPPIGFGPVFDTKLFTPSQPVMYTHPHTRVRLHNKLCYTNFLSISVNTIIRGTLHMYVMQCVFSVEILRVATHKIALKLIYEHQQ